MRSCGAFQCVDRNTRAVRNWIAVGRPCDRSDKRLVVLVKCARGEGKCRPRGYGQGRRRNRDVVEMGGWVAGRRGRRWWSGWWSAWWSGWWSGSRWSGSRWSARRRSGRRPLRAGANASAAPATCGHKDHKGNQIDFELHALWHVFLHLQGRLALTAEPRPRRLRILRRQRFRPQIPHALSLPAPSSLVTGTGVVRT